MCYLSIVSSSSYISQNLRLLSFTSLRTRTLSRNAEWIDTGFLRAIAGLWPRFGRDSLSVGRVACAQSVFAGGGGE